MDLGLRGKSLQSVLIENTVRMQLSDVYFVVIESPFRLDVHGDSFALSPEKEPDTGLQPLRQLVGHTIEEATADAAGGLHVIFEGGARLTVEPDAAYEAWSVSAPDGALVVSTAGGKLAIWKSQSNADESAETSPDQ
ncbi:MAG: hypothetical protein QOC69_6539 [Mycobacterium sp.]|jgi:hypothetical protein|nr:hypothetical protein [Mycobacterium sp.]